MSKEKIKILFVCMGNICRSPTAEGAFKSQIEAKNVEHLFEIDSPSNFAVISYAVLAVDDIGA